MSLSFYIWDYLDSNLLLYSNKLNPPKGGAAIRFFTPPAGRVKKILGVDEVRDRNGVVDLEVAVKEGSLVNEVANSRDRSGYLLVKSNDVKSAVANCEKLMNEVQILVE